MCYLAFLGQTAADTFSLGGAGLKRSFEAQNMGKEKGGFFGETAGHAKKRGEYFPLGFLSAVVPSYFVHHKYFGKKHSLLSG